MKLKKIYSAPTPLVWRKIGDSLLAASTTLSAYAILDGWEKPVTLVIIISGTVGKFLSNLFTVDSAK